MRYTTIIALNELPVYQNVNARLVYLHLSLIAGYHDNDRDIADISFRRLALACGVTLSALRHALTHLERAGLIKRDGPVWIVTKWLPTTKISKRKAPDVSSDQRKADAAREDERRTREAEQRQADKEARTSGFIKYYEEQLRLAKNGDLNAQHIVKARRHVYLETCKNLNRKPIENND